MNGVDLVTFLRTRLDEMAEDARQLTEALAGSIPSSAPFAIGMKVSDAIAQRYNLMSRYRMDPAFVLADVAAKRRIVEVHADPKHYCAPGPIDRDGYTWHEAGEKRWADIPCLHLRLLAAPFARHPDFDPAWAVEGTVTT